MYRQCSVLAACLIVLACAAGTAASRQPSQGAASGPEPGPGPTPGAGCSMATDKKACGKEKGCVWCEGFGPGSCYDKAQAKFLPKQYFKCKKPKKGDSSSLEQSATAAAAAPTPGPGPTPGAGCSMAMDKKGCGKEKGCVWCEGSFGPGSCYDKAQAKSLPKQFYKCKKPKAAASLEQPAPADPNPGPGPTPGAGCSMATEKKACGKEKGCVWCEGSFGPGSCYDEAQAKFLPKQFYKCKKPKPSLEQPAPADPNPGPGPTPGAGCSMATEKKACGKEKGCVWCEGSFGPGSCYDEAQAKFLPKQFYKCKKPKPSLEQPAPADPNPGPGPTPGAGCSMATEKKACGKEKGCVWCEGSFGPGSCYDEAQAKFLPKQFYKCKKPKQSAEADAPAEVEPLSIGCMAMSKKACEGESGCVWCNSSMGPAKCYEEAEAKFLPKPFYKCVAAKTARAPAA